MAMDLQTLHTDGANFYQYLRGNPFMGSDPLGLFGFDAGVTYAQVGFKIGSLAHDLVSIYSANQDSDADWAMDWSMPDEFHTRGDASWVNDVYAEHDVNQFVDDFMNPVAIARSTTFYQQGTKAVRYISIGGKLVKEGAKHHLLFRMLSKFRKGTAEIMLMLPPGMHKDLHRYVDKHAKNAVAGAPSMWDPGGERKWKAFMEQGNNSARYFRAVREATLKFLENKVDDLRPVMRALDDAGF